MECQESIKAIVQVLKHEYKPERVILFGSCVSGRVTRDSDIDMLIVKNTKSSYGKRWVEVGRLVRNIQKPLPFAPFILTPKELKLQLKRNLFLQAILAEGKVLYEKS